MTSHPSYYTTSHGIDVQIIKRMSNRWMTRLAASYSTPREFWGDVRTCGTDINLTAGIRLGF